MLLRTLLQILLGNVYNYFKLGVYIVELLGCKVYVCLALVDTAKHSAWSTLPPAAYENSTCLLTLVIVLWFILSILLDVYWYFLMVFILCP